ncbi:MAG: hypothetical protein H6558_19665 [Lewinellaceae bacterium]|nr:hypothetical protein [Lewinellaceae bacterium]
MRLLIFQETDHTKLTLNEIETYLKQLPSKKAAQDKQMLVKVGKFFKSASRKQLEPRLVFKVESLLTRIYNKYADKSNSEDIEDLMVEARGLASELGYRLEKDKIDADFFKKAIQLGKLLIKIGKLFEFLILPMIIAPEESEEIIRRFLENLN